MLSVMKKRGFYINAAVLAGGSILLRLSGLWFRSYICGRIGAQGMGLYQLIFSVFTLGITACTSGIGLAVTRLTSEGRGSTKCIIKCMEFALALSFISAGVLFFSSGFIAVRFIGNSCAAAPLRILAPGLPFIAACACLKGYFFAIRNTVVPVCGELLEQGAAIGASAALLNTSLPPLNALMLGSTASEAAAFVYILIMFSIFARKNGLPHDGGSDVMHSILHIAGPMLVGSFLRSSLYSAENLMIPAGLRRHGSDYISAVAQYGVVQGMVMPVVFFPMSFVTSVAALLIPEIAEARAKNRPGVISSYVQKAFRQTLLFGFIVTGALIFFADDIGIFFFDSRQAGTILRIIAPIAPIMYLDNMVDNILKGLDQQVYSLIFNFSDSLMRVALIAVFIPMFGIKAYIAIIFASEIYNASLSIGRLLKVSRVKVKIAEWIVIPALSGALVYFVLCLIRKILL